MSFTAGHYRSRTSRGYNHVTIRCSDHVTWPSATSGQVADLTSSSIQAVDIWLSLSAMFGRLSETRQLSDVSFLEQIIVFVR